jgi:hypothetical protein
MSIVTLVDIPRVFHKVEEKRTANPLTNAYSGHQQTSLNVSKCAR